MLKEEPTYPEALIGRGTAYAFQRELENAIDDFTKVFVYLTRVVTHSGLSSQILLLFVRLFNRTQRQVRPGSGEDRLVLLLGNLLMLVVPRLLYFFIQS